jgi:L-lactate permease
MWQITWILGILPDWFWTLVLWAGILATGISYIVAKIPVLGQYKLPLRIGGIVAIVIGVYFQGAIANEEKWQARVKELEEKLQVAEEKSKQENAKIESKVVTKIQVIKEAGEEIIKYIDKNNEIIKFVENCPLPKEVIGIHNSAALMNKADKK